MIENKIKPEILLRELENTFVNVKTKSEMQQLMRVFEICGVKMKGYPKNPLDKIKSWDSYGEGTCVSAYTAQRLGSSGFGVDPLENVKRWNNLNVLSIEEYYEKQGINQEKLNKVNDYFN